MFTITQIGGINSPKVSTFASTKNVITEAKTTRTAIYTDGSNYYLDNYNNTIDGIKVPEELNSKFSIEIKGLHNGIPIKLYGGPSENMELNAPGNRPDIIVTNDVTVYNDHFIKITDDNGAKMYVDMNTVDTSIKPITEMMVVDGEVISGERNVTMNLTSRTFISANEIDALMAGTHLDGIGQAVHETELKYGVNALFILAVAINESGWGSSYLAQSRNNLFGICAYDSNTDAASSFGSKADCIDYFGRLIKNGYFGDERTDLYSINEIYASDTHWSTIVGSTMNQLANQL
jgi:beta-N-acetylglucosaminidase